MAVITCAMTSLLVILGSPFLANAATTDKGNTECLSNKDCDSDRLCAEFQCINPCLLNLCDDPRNCKVTNHIPVCACTNGFSGVLTGNKESLCNKGSQGNGQKKYKLFSVIKVNWYQALAQCNANNMQLASIDNQQEYNTLVTMIKQANLGIVDFWTSGTDLADHSNYLWISSGRPMTYFNWRKGEPNHYNHDGEIERCVELTQGFDYRMNDAVCSEPNLYVCEYFE